MTDSLDNLEEVRDGSHTPLSTQMGGHPGVLTTEDGSLIIKPSLPLEVAFYQSIGSDPALSPLRHVVPSFLGTLRLEGQVDPQTAEGDLSAALTAVQEVVGAVKDEYTWALRIGRSVVLENLSYPFLKPNILDVKLGTVLYDQDATPEKRARMEKVARETTSEETGMRMTAFQVHDLVNNDVIYVSKAYGKALQVDQLPEGFARFFPLAAPNTSTGSGTGLPPDLLLEVLYGLRDAVADIRARVAAIEMRLVGASLLLIYEADHERAGAAIRHSRQLELEALEKEEQQDVEDDDESDDEEDDDETKDQIGPLFVAKLIDFAHARFTPGMGPDEGVLKGLTTILQLIEARIEQDDLSRYSSLQS